jgi:hypothetical protein
LKLLRREWTLAKAYDRAWCEVWSNGPHLEVRLVKGGTIVLRDQARAFSEQREIERAWREGMESQGWRRIADASARKVGRPPGPSARASAPTVSVPR